MVHFTGKSAPTDPKMTLTGSRSNSIHMAITYIPQGPKFVRFILRWAVFELRANFAKMTLICSRLKVSTCIQPSPPRPKFSSVSFYNGPFLSYGPCFGKVHRTTPNDLDICKVKIPTGMLHTPTRPKCSSVSLYGEAFLSYGPILEKCTEWPQITLTCSR